MSNMRKIHYKILSASDGSVEIWEEATHEEVKAPGIFLDIPWTPEEVRTVGEVRFHAGYAFVVTKIISPPPTDADCFNSRGDFLPPA